MVHVLVAVTQPIEVPGQRCQENEIVMVDLPSKGHKFEVQVAEINFSGTNIDCQQSQYTNWGLNQNI